MPTLRAWLEQIGLAQYTSQLEDAAIDFDVLPHLSDEHQNKGVRSILSSIKYRPDPFLLLEILGTM